MSRSYHARKGKSNLTGFGMGFRVFFGFSTIECEFLGFLGFGVSRFEIEFLGIFGFSEEQLL